jgi:Secretion system C-terminal sorting domain
MPDHDIELKVEVWDNDTNEYVFATKVVTVNPESVTFINHIETSENYGSLILNENHSDPISSGDSRNLIFGNNYTIRTDELPFIVDWNSTGKTEKHINWTFNNPAIPPVYLLNYNFTLQASTERTMKSTFQSTEPAAIRTIVDGEELSGLDLKFNDPWFYYKDGNNNWYQSDEFLPYTSPLEMYNSSPTSYGGIFLNQEVSPDHPYYSVQSPLTQTKNLGGAIGTRTFYFQNWSTQGGVSLQQVGSNPPGYDQKAVVFTSAGAAVYANLKGQLMSNDQNGINSSSQRKIVRTDNGYYHLVYESMGNVWYTHSLTTDYYGDWSKDELLMTNATNPSLDYTGNDVYIVYEIEESGWQVIYVQQIVYYNGNWEGGWYAEIPGMVVTNTGNANPVIYCRSDEVFVIAKPTAIGGLKYTYIIDPENPSSQWSTPADLSGTDQYSVNPTLAGRKLGNDDNLHISYESKSRIYYLRSYRSGSERRFDTPVADISTGSSYSVNKFPSISLVNNQYYPIVTWRGSYKTNVAEKRMGKETDGMIWIHKTVVRVKSSLGWGTFSAFGNKVDYPNINSIETNDETIIAWTENQGQYAKYVKRAGSFRQTQPLSSNGTYVQLSNGTDLDNLKTIVFNIDDQPLYNLVRTADDFTQEFGGGGLGKQADVFDLSYGRSGVIEKSDIEFVFNIGDIFLDGETVKFIERADTLPVTNIEELNSFVKTENMQLSSSSELLFSNYYYVVRPELADSVLSDDFTVTFKCELVRSATDEVIGVFDQITYSKYNVEKYDNPNYIVDCNGIETGEYYFRLITEVTGESNPSLTNIEKDNITLEKANYKNVGFRGTTLPMEYALAQNYPNPFNPSTTIRYQIPQDGFVTLKVYDILGSEVAILVNEEKTSGRYEVNFNASSLASGVYIYRLTSGNFTASKKLLLLK